MEDTATSGAGAKRAREEWGELPETKRLRADLLLDILDDVDDKDPATTGDLADVMKSFEEEIALLPPAPETSQAEDPCTGFEVESEESRQPELGFLFDASDDELGLPPTASPSEGSPVAEVAEEVAGFGQLWGFEDEIPSSYEGIGSVFDEDAAAAAVAAGGGVELDGMVFGGGLFDDDLMLSWPSDFQDSTRRPESLPAV